jgi:hypothetical protein
MKAKGLLIIFLLSSLAASAQMWNGQDTLYGNEWIDYDQSYYKIPVSEDGLYRITYQSMATAGIPLNSFEGSQLQLFHLGEEQPIYVSSSGTLSDGDYIEFYGTKNRSELDRYLFGERDSTMLNPWYSLVTDTSAYFLTWTNEGVSTSRFESISNELSNLPPKETWYWAEEEVYYTEVVEKYHILNNARIYHSYYDREGFTNGFNKQHNFSVPINQAYQGGPEADLNLRFLSTPRSSNDAHWLEVMLENQVVETDTFFNSQFRSLNLNFDPASVGENVEISVRGNNGSNDTYAIGGASIKYPRNFSASDESALYFTLSPSMFNRYIEVTNLGGSGVAVLYDLDGKNRIIPALENGVWKVKVPAYDLAERALVLSREHTLINEIIPVAFTDYSTQDAEYLIITSQQLRVDGTGEDQIQAYADYRSSIIGGGYNVRVVNVEDLYEQFAYGIHRHPLSIRNFINYLRNEWDDLGYCFLIGKGREYIDIRQDEKIEEAKENGYLHLPAYGFPGSDNLLVSNGVTPIPLVPVGRLAAINGEEVRLYLDKVQAMENQFDSPQFIENKAWMRQVMHLGGGSTPEEQNTIRAYLQSMEAELSQNLFGANVKSFYKTSTEPIQATFSDQIFNTINEGTSIISFFGHSSPGTFDFNIDNPDNYFNIGKYPLMLSLGCYSGNIFVNGRSIGERFTFYENKAAVAYGASRGIGFISSLGAFARSYYARLGGEFYGQGIGDALKATLSEYKDQAFIGTSTLIEQFTLHGDPAIRLYPSDKPDYVIDAASVSFTPTIISATEDTFLLDLDILNIGKNTGDTIALTVSRIFPSGVEKLLLKDTISVTRFRQTVTYKLATQGSEGAGLNTFKAMIDADGVTAELSESNNSLESSGKEGIQVFIIDNSARPLYPVNFSIVSEDSVVLKVSSTNVLAPERTYLLELDTTPLFNSLQKRSASITQRGGVINWVPDVDWQDSTVYHWRISPDSTIAEIGYIWEESSFTYIESSEEGWQQGGYWQSLEGEEYGIEFDSSGTFSFSPAGFFITLKLKKNEEQDPPVYSFNFQGAAGSVRPWNFMDEGIAVVVGDSITGAGWKNMAGGEYGSVNDPVGDTRVFAYPTGSFDNRASLIHFLDEVIPSNSYVFLFTVINTDTSNLEVEQWAADSTSLGKNLFSLMESEGAQAIRSLEQLGSVHYGIIYQKGKGVLAEGIASSIDDILSVETYVPIEGYEGRYTSPVFGMAEKWNNIFYHFEDIEPVDNIRVSLMGVSNSGEKELLVDSVAYGEDISHINPEEYPGLELSFYASDTENRTSPQLKYWTISGRIAPDLGINPIRAYSFHADTLQKGEDLRLTYFIEPIIKTITDSIKVNYSIISENNQVEESIRWFPEGIGVQGRIDSLEISASNLSVGRNNLLVQVNTPDGITEQSYFNNLMNIPFFVSSDLRNPIMDVTFDGRKIIDGDIISSEPLIVIRLVDENEFLLLDDSSTFTIELINPESDIQKIEISDENVMFIPAVDSEKNEASILYRPVFEKSGIYKLRVKGEDASGNSAGRYAYEISFEVILENSISNIFNYPNPFSTSTQFVYTLTGEQPTYYSLQIMTVSGRVVREISQAELGPLEIGTHKTEYAWDGTDDFGDRLANGVYLYRFIARDQFGESFEKYERETDRFFKNGIGKLVILR